MAIRIDDIAGQGNGLFNAQEPEVGTDPLEVVPTEMTTEGHGLEIPHDTRDKNKGTGIRL